MSDLDIVIVNWNGGGLVRACLASLAAAEAELGDALALHVVVVDNGSTDGSADGLPALAHGPRVVRAGANLGFARACNRGAAEGRAGAILFLNPDTRVTAESLRTAYAALMADPATGIVGARQVAADGNVERSCARAPTASSLLGQALLLDRLGLVPTHFMTEWDHLEDRAVDQVMGAFLMIRRDLFARLAGFDPRFFVYYEDVDLCLRARQAGFAVRHVAGAVIRHEGQGTTRQARAHRLFYILRSGVLYAGKHHGRATALALLALSLLAQVPMRLALAALRRSPREAAEVLRAGALLAGAAPGLLRVIPGAVPGR
ncbi:glycosyltransferase family 2 protein [Methylobacterium dankookense]|uniref:N-acetylglucosaminyl-diphospho-decaprenol L-rhamnosyltransferase n=1 Tax=Methylobacterium dankookense TaxID=560405 RepID=A0A564FYJ6_9HYPH|nr:glycosyltransferase family 2 protein [Methylobacterium dankookense]GJD59080.1 N-acetylglucosaminyl-diphospho-decaprenol L-rhamnosyltransferase [Methylobacterium dankookense]VUF13062.1 N-acetylglucosaminyl-diphospho-decaprenol L-rhamnosyltransferase [Methylobacterium dankookense]